MNVPVRLMHFAAAGALTMRQSGPPGISPASRRFNAMRCSSQRFRRFQRPQSGVAFASVSVGTFRRLPPNNRVNRTAQQRRCWVPFALRAPAAGYAERYASARGRMRHGRTSSRGTESTPMSATIAPHVWTSRLRHRCPLDKKGGARLSGTLKNLGAHQSAPSENVLSRPLRRHGSRVDRRSRMPKPWFRTRCRVDRHRRCSHLGDGVLPRARTVSARIKALPRSRRLNGAAWLVGTIGVV
jgi:hypothetical protein